jgi:hypothetical protein
MIDMTHENIERIWNSITTFIPDRHKLDAAVDFVKTLDDIGVEENEIKASAEYDPKLEEAINTIYDDSEEKEDDWKYDDRYEDD